jgi:hypothetical protein
VIASLRYEEIVFLGSYYALYKQAVVDNGNDKVSAAAQASRELSKKLIPSVFSSDLDIKASATAITRTGFLLIYENMIGAGTVFEPSPLFEKVCKLASFENLFEEE